MDFLRAQPRLPLTANLEPPAPGGGNLTWHHGEVTRADREGLLKQRGCTLWFTGLSGSGKSTIAARVERLLLEAGVLSFRLDGDNVRQGLNRDLSFAANDRQENIRRIAEVAKLFCDSGIVVLSAFISPYRADRARARETLGSDFIEVYINTPLEVCEERDPKGLYQKARRGDIRNFTGLDSPYEAPVNAEIEVKTAAESLDASAARIVAYLQEKKKFLKATQNG